MGVPGATSELAHPRVRGRSQHAVAGAAAVAARVPGVRRHRLCRPTSNAPDRVLRGPTHPAMGLAPFGFAYWDRLVGCATLRQLASSVPSRQRRVAGPRARAPAAHALGTGTHAAREDLARSEGTGARRAGCFDEPGSSKPHLCRTAVPGDLVYLPQFDDLVVVADAMGTLFGANNPTLKDHDDAALMRECFAAAQSVVGSSAPEGPPPP